MYCFSSQVREKNKNRNRIVSCKLINIITPSTNPKLQKHHIPTMKEDEHSIVSLVRKKVNS